MANANDLFGLSLYNEQAVWFPKTWYSDRLIYGLHDYDFCRFVCCEETTSGND
jgi:hypothetical protein